MNQRERKAQKLLAVSGTPSAACAGRCPGQGVVNLRAHAKQRPVDTRSLVSAPSAAKKRVAEMKAASSVRPAKCLTMLHTPKHRAMHSVSVKEGDGGFITSSAQKTFKTQQRAWALVSPNRTRQVSVSPTRSVIHHIMSKKHQEENVTPPEASYRDYPNATEKLSATLFSPAYNLYKKGNGDTSVRVVITHHKESASTKHVRRSALQPVDAPHPLSEATSEDEETLAAYAFIRSLPPRTLSKTLLLPLKTRSSKRKTLVLDLDETLVHCSTTCLVDPDFSLDVRLGGRVYTVQGRIRPYAIEFLQHMADYFEVVVFTASMKEYAHKVLDILDPGKKFIKHRLFREACSVVCGVHMKDLALLGRDMKDVVMIDNMPEAFGYQLDNGIPIKSWYSEKDDVELVEISKVLNKLKGVEDVRHVLVKEVGLTRKVHSCRR